MGRPKGAVQTSSSERRGGSAGATPLEREPPQRTLADLVNDRDLQRAAQERQRRRNNGPTDEGAQGARNALARNLRNGGDARCAVSLSDLEIVGVKERDEQRDEHDKTHDGLSAIAAQRREFPSRVVKHQWGALLRT